MRTKQEYQDALDKLKPILSDYSYTSDRDWEAFYKIKELIDNLEDNK